MIEYPKIEGLFLREDGTKRLLEGQYRNPTVEYLKDNIWEFTEKIDGTNISIVWDGHKVDFHGRTERAQIPAELVGVLMRTFSSATTEELFEQEFGETEVIFYGEGYGRKIQKVGYRYRNDVSFILFDVYLPKQNLWLKRDAVNNIANTFGVDVVPVVLEGTIDEGVTYVKAKPSSTIGVAPMEGIVGRPKTELIDRRGNRVIVKIKTSMFAEEGK